jgi:hypothetical protein
MPILPSTTLYFPFLISIFLSSSSAVHDCFSTGICVYYLPTPKARKKNRRKQERGEEDGRSWRGQIAAVDDFAKGKQEEAGPPRKKSWKRNWNWEEEESEERFSKGKREEGKMKKKPASLP